jgi:hypothetical protein
MQTWCDLLNTPISQAPLTPDELAGSTPLHRQSNASPTPHPHALFQPPSPQPSYPPPYHYPLYSYPSHPVGGSLGAHAPPPYPYVPPPPLVSDSSGANAHPLYPYPPPPPYGYPPYSYPPLPTGGSLGGPTPQPYSYPPLLTYPYPPPQPVHSGGDDNSGGGDNTSHTTQAPSRMKKRNEWTPADEEKLVLLNFIISLSCIQLVCYTYNLGFQVHA